MLSKLAKILLVATSLAPILLTLWFSKAVNNWNSESGILDNLLACCDGSLTYLIIAILLVTMCYLIMKASQKYFDRLPVTIKSVKTADKEIVGFLIVYLLPLINQTQSNVSTPVLIFIATLVFIVLYNTHSYHFNPLLGIFGYHFYEVSIEGDISFILITKQNITNSNAVKKVVQLTEYIILEV